MLVYDIDEIAICDTCTPARRELEVAASDGDGQAGARWVGHQREDAMRPTLAERVGPTRKTGET
jgi:hypothetical protein